MSIGCCPVCGTVLVPTRRSVVADCPKCSRSFLESAPDAPAPIESNAPGAPFELDAAFRATYDVERLLGRGGMAVVVAATRRADRRAVAIKLLDAQFGQSLVARFERELELLERLSHPNVIGFLGSGTTGGVPYLVMEMVPRGSLADLLAERGTLSPPEAVRMASQILAGLAHCHEHGILHRDLKPANVLIGQAGEPKLADLGLARAMDSATLTAAGAQIGTPRYVAPEVLRGAKAGPATDVYAVALILHECIRGEPAFLARGLPALLAKILGEPAPALESGYPDLDRAVAQALSKDPRDRPGSARAFAELLARSMPAEPGERPPSSLPARGTARPPVSRGGPHTLSMIVVAAGAVLLGAAAVSSSRRTPEAPVASSTPGALDVDLEARLTAVESTLARMAWSDLMTGLDQQTFAGDYVGAEARSRSIARQLDSEMDGLRALEAAAARPGPDAALLSLRRVTAMLEVQVRGRRLAERVRALGRARALERTANDDVTAWLGSIVKPRAAEDADLAILERAVSGLPPAMAAAAAHRPLERSAVQVLSAAAQIGVCARQLNFSTPQRQRWESRLDAALRDARAGAAPATSPLADAVDALLADTRALKERATLEKLERARSRLIALAAAEQIPGLARITLND